MNSVVCRLLQRVLHPPKSPHRPRVSAEGCTIFSFFGIFCVFFRMQKIACISEGFFSKIHRFSLPRGTPKSRKIDEFRCLQPALFASSVFPSFFYRFLVFFHNFHGSARCVFSAFLQRPRACLRPVSLRFAEMRHSRIYCKKQYEINIFKVPLFSRFSS